ncbi:MAG TPA: hypothetical protein VFQ35_05830 [Polyangiaceae bacterium]|nr:hypothetical protein [Polyangiaceae bacterium]
MLATTEQVEDLVSRGKSLILAGEEQLLASLPKGNWIGGTIPYFVGAEGGRTTRDHIFVQPVADASTKCTIQVYDAKTISQVAVDSPEPGYTVLILPAFSQIHQDYALNAPNYEQLFFKVVGGWIAGIHLDDLGKKSPKVFNGFTGETLASAGVAMHVELPPKRQAQLGIVNIFEQGNGDELRFPKTGFSASECLVNGERRNLAEYYKTKGIDSRLPLVADFCGAMINVSIQAIDDAAGVVKFYAPVFDTAVYRVAKPVANYAKEFGGAIPTTIKNPVFSCNCVLNYLHGELENRRTGSVTGPMTFGEIGYQLLNQTLVYITVP